MNLKEIKKACDENLTVINSLSQEIKILFIGERSILIAELNFSKGEYKVARNEHYIAKWKLKPVTKKYYLWKVKNTSSSDLHKSTAYYSDDFCNTKGDVAKFLRDAHYKEKIESTMHEE